MSGAFTWTIDGRRVLGRAGQTVMQAAEAEGIRIPRLCWLAELSPSGSCRLCTVIANGRAQAACTLPVAEGMTVENDTEELRSLRRSLVEMLFVEGNHVCSVCEANGACELQALARDLGMTAPGYPYRFPRRETDASHPEIFVDRDRCVLCRRCVRASDERDGKRLFAVVGRGAERRIAVASAAGLGGTDARPDDHAIRACPTGALVVAREAYAVPIGRRRFDRALLGTEPDEAGEGR